MKLLGIKTAKPKPKPKPTDITLDHNHILIKIFKNIQLIQETGTQNKTLIVSTLGSICYYVYITYFKIQPEN